MSSIQPPIAQIADPTGRVAKLTPGDDPRFGGLDVAIQDQTTPIVDLFFHDNSSDEGQLLALPTAIDDRTISLLAAATITVGDIVCIKEGERFYQGFALAADGGDPNVITMNTPLDFAFTTAALVCIGKHEWNVNGSVTPKIFSISPPNGTKWDVVRLNFYLQDGTVMDDSLFGGIAALTNGIVLRKKDGIYKNIFNVRSNGDLSERMTNTAYSDKAPAGSYGFTARRIFGGQQNNGVVIRLNGESNDELQLIVQDDLTGLETCRIVAQGHVVE